MTILKNITAILTVIICVGFVILAGCTTTSTGTSANNYVDDRLNYGSFLNKGSSYVERISIETQNNYLYEHINSDGKYTSFRGKYTINQINSTQDPVFLLINQSGTQNFIYNDWSGATYLTLLDRTPMIYLLAVKDNTYMRLPKLAGGYKDYSGMDLAGNPDFEVYMLSSLGYSVPYTGKMGGESIDGYTPHIYPVNGRSVSAVFQKSGDKYYDSPLTVIVYDARNHRIVKRATTNVPGGMVSVTS